MPLSRIGGRTTDVEGGANNCIVEDVDGDDGVEVAYFGGLGGYSDVDIRI